MPHSYTNKLIDETSPYLLQHAHNPVNWYPWGEEALQLAKELDKPLLVSIGYAACHWCHVMERESFEDEDTASIMNELFVNIKIDREERPDLDHIFMDAIQAMQGHGGWPLNVFLTPDGKPFYGGTYFPPVKAYNRLSWKDVLTSVSHAFKERRSEIESQSEQLTMHLEKANSFGRHTPGIDNLVSEESAQVIADNIMKSADKQWGGFGQAPKFPQSFVIMFLLRHYHTVERGKKIENISSETSVYLKQALLSIDKMIDGGIYDQLGGGFSRYSTDAEWLVPHFEKMLYDNALLLSVISEAYQITGNKRYFDVIKETIEFVHRELMHEEGGFYSAIDADSEGEEGLFYVWNYEDVIGLLGKEAEIFCEFFDIRPEGNWHEGKPGEKKNILWRQQSVEEFCNGKNIDKEFLNRILDRGKNILFSEREKRKRPLTDDKILLGWNALMNSALSKSFGATGIEEYRNMAVSNMEFLLTTFVDEEGKYFHSWKSGIPKHPAFLDDLAFLIHALIHLQEITGDTTYLFKAKDLAKLVIREYKEERTSFYFFTGKSQNDVLVRKKEIYDGATPSGNAVMAENLLKLSLYFDLPGWKSDALQMIQTIGQALTRYPVSFGFWSCLLLFFYKGIDEIVILGKDNKPMRDQLLRVFLPHKILLTDHIENEALPLHQNKLLKNKTAIYLCRNYACLNPVFTIEDLLDLLKPK